MTPHPTLPARAPDPEARQRALSEARERYVYDRSYHGLPFVTSLPISEQFSPRYLARGAEVSAQIKANQAAGELAERVRPADERDPFGAWSRMFPLLPAPAAAAIWQNDWAFAWQRVAGPAPVQLTRIDALPPCLPLTDDDLRAVTRREGDRLADALAARRLYAADYAVFEGVRGGATDGQQKHLWAPVALFVVDPSSPSKLSPVAIQVNGHGGRAEGLYRPADPDWRLARAVVQVADENLQGVLVHLGWCHMVAQCFLVAARRQLAPEHPLLRLLEPHFEYTLAVNQVARKSVVSAGGTQDRLLGPSIEDQMALLGESLRGLDAASLDPRAELARRGVDDAEALPCYPFRDDSLLLWDATRSFVDGYVRLYYPDDASVLGDDELAGWVREVGAPEGGQMPRLVEGLEPRTVEGVVDLVTRVLFRVTAYHAAINDVSYDWVGYAPNMPTAGFAPLPPRGAGHDLRAMLAPRGLAWEAIEATWQVAALKLNHLGEYPASLLAAPGVAPLVDRFKRSLAEVEATIQERNKTRPVPYEHLLPSRITASINA